MKKILLFASMAVLGLSAAAQGVDPASYDAKEGYELRNKWIMQVGNGEAATKAAWDALPLDDFTKATAATILDGKAYITCSQTFYDGVDSLGNAVQLLGAYGHLVELDAETGKLLRKIDLTLDGNKFEGLLCANHIGKDDFGHLWITGYVSNTYSEADGTAVVKPINLYQVDIESGALTLVNAFALDEDEGPGQGARIDHCDLIGDITRENARCVFMACPNEIAATYTWYSDQGSEEWGKGANEDSGYVVTGVDATSPADQTAWNYTPMVRMVYDPEYSGALYYVDGHPTRPVLYDEWGEAQEMLADYIGVAEEGVESPWDGFMPVAQVNGVRQFGLNGQEFLGYALNFPNDADMGGEIAIVKLDENQSMEAAVPMWIAPAGQLGIKKGGGRFYHSIEVTPEYEVGGKYAIDILIYKESNGIAVYTLAEEGFFAGIEGVEIENTNAPVEYFNLNGVRVNENSLVPGLYITRQGTKASKVIVK